LIHPADPLIDRVGKRTAFVGRLERSQGADGKISGHRQHACSPFALVGLFSCSPIFEGCWGKIFSIFQIGGRGEGFR